jgi:hypothetical protein
MGNKMKRLAIIIITVMIFYPSIIAANNGRKITFQEAIEIASKEAVSRGFPVDKLKMNLFVNTTIWKMVFPEDPHPVDAKEDYISNLKEPYILIWFTPYKGHDGDIAVYINSDTGQIIEVNDHWLINREKCSTCVYTPSMERINADDAFTIAKNKSDTYGYSLSGKDIALIKDSLPWFFKFGNSKVLETGYTDSIEKKLEGEKYWAVYAKPANEPAEKGDICFFINRLNGEIIEVYKGPDK